MGKIFRSRRFTGGKAPREHETFKITDGKIKTDLQERAGELAHSIEEGFPDQTIMFHATMVKHEIEELQKKLKDVM